MLERFTGKGSWTFAPVPTLLVQPAGKSFGMLKVTGRLDELELPPMHLMPLGQGRRFLPLKAALRQQIGKHAGDVVHLVLYADIPAAGVSETEFLDCLADVPGALPAYQRLSGPQQQAWRAWVEAAASEDALIIRVSMAAEQLAAGYAAPLTATSRK